MNLQLILNETMLSFESRVTEVNWENPQVYASWLAQTWFFVKESTRLLNLCGAHMPQSMESLHNRFIDHAKEEQGHADALLRDLHHLGFSIEDFQEGEETAAFYQTQYFLIQHRSPLDFFGYILLLEGVAVKFGENIYGRVKNAHGRKCASFLQIHGAEDPDHLEKAFRQLASLEMKQQATIVKNFYCSAYFYKRILEKTDTALAAPIQSVS